MAYMTTILRVIQDLAGLGWVRYDAAFRRLVALSGNNNNGLKTTLPCMPCTLWKQQD